MRRGKKNDLLKLTIYTFSLGFVLLASLEGFSQRVQFSQPDATQDITPEELIPFFDEAASAFNIPSELLKAIGVIESGWDQSQVSLDGGHGIMQLTGATLSQAARLLQRLNQVVELLDPLYDQRAQGFEPALDTLDNGGAGGGSGTGPLGFCQVGAKSMKL